MTITQATLQVDHLRLINDELKAFFAGNLHRAVQISPFYGDLWRELQRLALAGGKRLRPQMTFMAYAAFGGEDFDKLLPIAAAQELLHLSMLIHDDVIDRDHMRYGVLNIEGAYDQAYEKLVKKPAERRHFAMSAGMLGGDLLLSSAYALMATSRFPAEKVTAAQQTLADAVFQVIGGELLDTESAVRAPGTIDSLEVARHKTAAYTTVCPLLTGAKMAGASRAALDSLLKYAENLGIAFQLADDILSTFGDELETGKSTTSDIMEGKRTVIVEQFEKLATPVQRTAWKKYFANQRLTATDFAKAKQLLIDSGARAATVALIDQFASQARRAIDGLPVGESAKADFDALVTKASQRSK